ncbi:MAG: sortase [Patescibacteria group bacterium]
MTQKQGYLLAAGLFVGALMIMGFPYFQARFLSTGTLPLAEGADSVADESGTVVETAEPNTLKIASLAIETPVIYVEDKTESVYQEALRDGVVHYPGTALPGEHGNVYIFGHSSDYVWSPGEYKTVFARLPTIELGAVIEITDAEGKLFHYIVTETKVVGPRDLTVLDQLNYAKQILTLQTSYPLGTALQRYIVVAELKVD